LEAAIRVLWASRSKPGSQNPWLRLKAHWDDEDRKWANEAIAFAGTMGHAKITRVACQEVLGHKDVEGNPIEKARGIQELLKDIDEANQSQGFNIKGGLGGNYSYVNIYRVLCWASHSHIKALRRNKNPEYLRHARIGLVVACWYLL
jgi:hypothetical protein